MQRLIAKIIETKELEKTKGEDGLIATKFLCKVKIIEPAQKDLKFPDNIKDKEHWIIRGSIFDWDLKADSNVILDPDETLDVIYPVRLKPTILQPNGNLISGHIEIYDPNQDITELEWKADFGELGKTDGKAKRGDRLHLFSKFELRLTDATKPGAYKGKLECDDKPPMEVVVPVLPKNKTLSYQVDANLDGFVERVIENNFVRVIITPHYGAALRELWYKSKRTNQFLKARHYTNTSGHVELGGHVDHMEEHGFPGRFWNANFVESESESESESATYTSPISSIACAVYSYDLKEDKIAKITREIQLFPNSPLIYQRITVSYLGRKEGTGNREQEKDQKDQKDQKEEKDEYEVSYWPRVQMAVGGKVDEYQVVKVPAKEKLFSWRFSKYIGYLEDYFGYQGGFALAQDEQSGISFLLFTDPEKINYFRVWSSERDIPEGLYTLEPRTKKVKLSPGQQVTHALLYAPASAANISQDAIAAISEGEAEAGHTPIFLLAKHKAEIDSCSATLRWKGRARHVVPLQKVEYLGVGTIWQGRTAVPTEAMKGLTAIFEIGTEKIKLEM